MAQAPYCSRIAKSTARNKEWKDEYTLLCEKCGYVVEGLDTAGPCPECGKPIAESLPERRVGTPWQQKPGFKSLIQTWWMTLRHPKRTLDIQSSIRPRWLALLTIIAASLIATVGWMLPAYLPHGWMLPLYLPPRGLDLSSPLITTVDLIVFASALPPLFFILKSIQSVGLRIFGNRIEYRITPEISTAITTHGTAGWILCAIGFSLAQLLGYFLIYMTAPPLIFGRGNRAFIHGPPQWAITVSWTLYILILPGLLFVVFFAYLGLRRCKYANRIRPQEQTDG